MKKSLIVVLFLIHLSFGCSDPGDVIIDVKSSKILNNAVAFARAGGPGSGESIIKLHTSYHIVRVGDFQWTKNHAGNWHTVGNPSPHGTRYVPKASKDAQAIAEYME
jgi:hypothetical protein